MKQLTRTSPPDFVHPSINKSQKTSRNSDIHSQGIRLRIASDFDFFSTTNFYNVSRVHQLCQTMYQIPYRRSTESESDRENVIIISSDDDDDDDHNDHADTPNAKSATGSDEAESIDSLLDGLKGLDINRETPATKTLDARLDFERIEARKEFLKTQEALLEPVKYDLDELYEKTAIPEPKGLVALTDEEEALVRQLLRAGQTGTVAQHNTAVVQYRDIQKLLPETWLNDEIINFYMDLIIDRADQHSEFDMPSVHCFNTFFCSALRDHGYNRVRRWTKRVDIFSKDLVFIPINYSYHWTLGAIDMKNKTVTLYDSLGGGHHQTLKLLMDYLSLEHQDKKKQDFDSEGWITQAPRDIPHQKNMSDCGVFTCTYAERLARRQPFDFSQDDMVLIRKRMVLSIYNKKIC